jgi:hypothetical protein
VQNKLLIQLTKWKTENQRNFDEDSRLSEKFNKAVIKLMSISFTQDATLSKIKSSLYNYLKIDLKTIIEYDFEF